MLWAFPHRRQLHKGVDKLNKLFEDIIQHKRQILSEQKERHEDPEKDLLTMMLEACEDTKDPSKALSNQELRDDLAVFFLAGLVQRPIPQWINLE